LLVTPHLLRLPFRKHLPQFSRPREHNYQFARGDERL
jgi:hypothetical protein